MDDLREIFRLLDWLNSCEAKGHVWVQQWTSNGTPLKVPAWVPVTCFRCGCAQG